MVILGIDTCLDACSVAVTDGAHTLACASEPMTRGHQERLAPLAAEAAARAGVAFDRIERIGVTLGPGSFTGLRVGLAFAKGLGAALDVPVVGVGTLEALAAGLPGLVFAAIDARRDQIYLQAFDHGEALMAPDIVPAGTAAARVAEIAQGRGWVVAGSGASLLEGLGGSASGVQRPDAAWVARLAASRAPAAPRPLYLRAPDARLPAA